MPVTDHCHIRMLQDSDCSVCCCHIVILQNLNTHPRAASETVRRECLSAFPLSMTIPFYQVIASIIVCREGMELKSHTETSLA